VTARVTTEMLDHARAVVPLVADPGDRTYWYDRLKVIRDSAAELLAARVPVEPEGYPCPTCHAQPGEPCSRKSNSERGPHHLARSDHAARAYNVVQRAAAAVADHVVDGTPLTKVAWRRLRL
jgi:hypothetical protein